MQLSGLVATTTVCTRVAATLGYGKDEFPYLWTSPEVVCIYSTQNILEIEVKYMCLGILPSTRCF